MFDYGIWSCNMGGYMGMILCYFRSLYMVCVGWIRIPFVLKRLRQMRNRHAEILDARSWLIGRLSECVPQSEEHICVEGLLRTCMDHEVELHSLVSRMEYAVSSYIRNVQILRSTVRRDFSFVLFLVLVGMCGLGVVFSLSFFLFVTNGVPVIVSMVTMVLLFYVINRSA